MVCSNHKNRLKIEPNAVIGKIGGFQLSTKYICNYPVLILSNYRNSNKNMILTGK